MFRNFCACAGAICLTITLFSACAAPGADSSGQFPASSMPSGSSSVLPDSSLPSGVLPDSSVPSGSSSVLPDASVQSPDVSGNEPEQHQVSVYDFSQPVPKSDAVDNSYFQDAAFVGDSRTDGFLIYSGIGCGENLTSNGLSIFKLPEKKAIKRDGVSYTLLEALALKRYGKVYLSLGVNELGYNDDEGFYRAYCDAIDAIRSCQPDAVIYIQGLIPVNEKVVAAVGGPSYLENDHLLVYNDLMKRVAREKQVAFLDLNPEFTDGTGQLPADASKDGVHLKSGYCKQWLEYLKIHTVDYKTLYPDTEMEK